MRRRLRSDAGAGAEKAGASAGNGGVIVAAWIGLSLLAGCAALPSNGGDGAGAAPATRADAPVAATAVGADDIPSLIVAGRLSVTTDSTEPDRSPDYSGGSFTWTERGDTTSIAFATPLGQIVAELWIEPGRARMYSNAGEEVAATPEALAARRLGSPLPVSGMRDWLRGRDHAGRQRAPDAFTEDGWTISYPRMADDDARPAVIRLRRAGPPAIDVRIVIDEWSLPVR